jgi:hypothetical protein
MNRYSNLLEKKGISLATVNSGSRELAFEGGDALEAIEILKTEETPILGGDVLSKDSEGLGYAYQIWGAKYHSLNWYCDKFPDESTKEYIERSIALAYESIQNAVSVAKKLDKECFFVLVV